MIWPFRPRCPLDVHNKVWTELWLARLAADFGVERWADEIRSLEVLRQAIIRKNQLFFHRWRPLGAE